MVAPNEEVEPVWVVHQIAKEDTGNPYPHPKIQVHFPSKAKAKEAVDKLYGAHFDIVAEGF